MNKKQISILTIILIIISLMSLYLTSLHYTYSEQQSKFYSDMIYAEPREDVISAEEMSRLFEEELDKYILIKSSRTHSQILDGDRENLYLSYSHVARNEYLINRLTTIIFIVLSILSWKVDKLKKNV